MLHKIFVVVIAMLIGVLAGCEKQPTPTAEPETPVKTEQEMKAEAQKEITADNLDQQLNQMEQDINADTQAQ